MKKIFIFVLLVFCHLFADSIDHLYFGVDSECDRLIKRESYVSCYSYVTKGPIWTAYITTDRLAAYRRERINDFKEDEEIPAEYRSTLSDYKGSGYERGHSHPNALADFSEQSQKESFLLSNITPQLAKFNRTAWKQLEKEVRYMAKKEKIISVFTGAIFKKGYKTIGNGVAVPDYFYKVILLPKSQKTYAFLLPHKELKRFDFAKYQVTVDEVEDLTGINFFSNLKPELQDEIEKTKFRFIGCD